MNTNNDFPEAIYHTEEPLTYLSEDVDEWFQQCIEDYPFLRKDKSFSERYLLHGIDVENWFNKWFRRFRDNKDLESEASKNE